jgi:hypothetical protein
LGPLEVGVVLDIIGIERLEAVARIILLLVEEEIEGLHGIIRWRGRQGSLLELLLKELLYGTQLSFELLDKESH